MTKLYKLNLVLPEIYLYFPPKISLIRRPKAPCRGKCGPTSERLSSLKGRKIIVFPDIDAFKDWQQKIFTFPHLDIRISRLHEDNATPADREAHIDLADWILKYLETDNNYLRFSIGKRHQYIIFVNVNYKD